MSEIAAVLLPFFGVIALGYGTAWRLKMARDGVAALSAFVYYIALPALFYQIVANTPASTFLDPSFVFGTTFATYCAFAIAFSLAALINRGNIRDATIQGLVGSYANVGYLAPALVIGALGVDAGAPMVLVFTFDSVMVFTLVPLMMALGGTERIDGRALIRAIARRVFLHPVIIATLIGLAVAIVNLPPPAPVGDIVAFLSAAAAPSALFLVGIVMWRQAVGGVSLETPLLLVVKMLIHPLIVYLLLSWIGGIDRVWVLAAVLMAALPPTANLVGIARRYDAYVDRAGTATVVGLFVSVVTVSAILWLVLNEAVPATPFG